MCTWSSWGTGPVPNWSVNPVGLFMQKKTSNLLVTCVSGILDALWKRGKGSIRGSSNIPFSAVLVVASSSVSLSNVRGWPSLVCNSMGRQPGRHPVQRGAIHCIIPLRAIFQSGMLFFLSENGIVRTYWYVEDPRASDMTEESNPVGETCISFDSMAHWRHVVALEVVDQGKYVHLQFSKTLRFVQKLSANSHLTSLSERYIDRCTVPGAVSIQNKCIQGESKCDGTWALSCCAGLDSSTSPIFALPI